MTSVQAAEPLLRFQHIAPESSFSPRSIVDVTQDRRGFLWFASLYGGFARYDGHEFRAYRYDPNEEGGLRSNSTNCVYVDPEKDVLWVCTVDGLLELDLVTDQSHLHEHDPAKPSSLPHPGIYRVLRDSEGQLWVGTNAGLARMDEASNEFEHFPLDMGPTAEGVHTPPNWVWELFTDRAGVLWVGTVGGGLLRHDPLTDAFIRFRHDPDDPASLPYDSVRALFEDESGRLWVGTDRALAVMTDRRNGRFEVMENIVTTSIREDLSGNLWVARRGGLSLLRSGAADFEHLAHDPDFPAGLGPGQIWRLHVDRGGRLWAPGDQISWLAPSALAFSIIGKPDFEYGPEPDLLVDEDGQGWVAGRDGLWQVDLTSEAWTRHVPFPEAEAPDANWVRGSATYRGHDGSYWVSAGGHISEFDPANGSFRSLELPVAPNAMSMTRDGKLWLGLPFHGLARLDRESGDFALFAHDPDVDTTLSHDFPYLVLEDRDGNLWIGTHRGLNRFDRASGIVRRYFSEAGQPGTLSNSTVRVGLLDRQGRLWFGTEFGLNQYDPEDDRFIRYLNGPDPGPNVYQALLEAEDGSFWIGTDAGLARFDPDSGKFENFTHSDGVPAGFMPELNLGPDGALYALAPGGVVRIDVTGLNKADTPPPLVWTYMTTMERGQGAQHEVQPPSRLSLSHRNELLTLGFSALDFQESHTIDFRYRMTGLSDEWTDLGEPSRKIAFAGLPPGDYTLEVQASRSAGAWTEPGLRLPIEFEAPPWRSFWAYCLYVLFLIGSVVLIVHWRTRLLRVRAIDLSAAVRDRTARLEKSEQTVRKQAEEVRGLLETKEQLFANVSHEFRTPLTLMLGPIEHARAATNNPEIQRQLDMAKRNGNRVLRLVDQLMELSRLTAQEELSRSPNPVGNVVETVVEAFEPLAREHGIAMTLRADRNLWSELPPDALERILMNLLSNALKFTREGGHVSVEVVPEGADRLILRVADTGMGIALKDQELVFERFERARGEGHGVPGSGIGLFLVKELVEAYEGTIRLDSAPGEGTTVEVCLPRHNPAPGMTVRANLGPSPALSLEVGLLQNVEEEESTQNEEGLDQPQVLVIEDNADMRAFVAQVLAGEFQVLTADTGEIGLELAQAQVPDIVISDVMMPGISGFEVAKALRSDITTSHIPIVLLTARGDDSSRLEGLREQVDDYLVKPFNPEELHLRVANLLAIREILRARFTSDLSLGRRPQQKVSSTERRFLDRVNGVMETYHGQLGFTVHNMAVEMAMSDRQLQRKLKALTGLSPNQYLRLYRLRRSQPMLAEGRPIGQVALEVGFSSPAHFSSCFRAQFGCTPTEFQQDPKRATR